MISSPPSSLWTGVRIVFLLTLCGSLYLNFVTYFGTQVRAPLIARQLRAANHSHHRGNEMGPSVKSVLSFPPIRTLTLGRDSNLYSHMFWEIAPGSKKVDGRWVLDLPPGPHRVIVDVGLHYLSPYVCLMKYG